MTNWPDPEPGLVIRYAYLWRREADQGRDEAFKDRPCAIVAAVQTEPDGQRVYVLPITHSPPQSPDEGIELPRQTKLRLDLDGERSWIIVSEANRFSWPGPDLRFLPGEGPKSAAYGFLPPGLFRIIRDRFVARGRQKALSLVTRTE